MFGRLTLVARAIGFGAMLLGSIFVPALPAGAADLSQPAGGRTALFNIEAPSTGTVIRNGAIYSISGWTAGSRVDVYLDGPSGVGAGIGSADVVGNRPDVARA